MSIGFGRVVKDEHIHDACIVDAKAGEPPRRTARRWHLGFEQELCDDFVWRYVDRPPSAPRLETDRAKRFSHERFAALLAETVDKIQQLGKLKGGEYAGDEDRLANFRRNAEALGLPMEAIWAVYYNKHHDAAMQFIKDKLHGKSRERMEPLEGRIDDMILYLILFKAMLLEGERS